MRSPHTEGDDGDHGTSVRHKTPLVGPILIGGLAFSITPEALGPRNCGQFRVAAALALLITAAPIKKANAAVFKCCALINVRAASEVVCPLAVKVFRDRMKYLR